MRALEDRLTRACDPAFAQLRRARENGLRVEQTESFSALVARSRRPKRCETRDLIVRRCRVNPVAGAFVAHEVSVECPSGFLRAGYARSTHEAAYIESSLQTMKLLVSRGTGVPQMMHIETSVCCCAFPFGVRAIPDSARGRDSLSLACTAVAPYPPATSQGVGAGGIATQYSYISARCGGAGCRRILIRKTLCCNSRVSLHVVHYGRNELIGRYFCI